MFTQRLAKQCQQQLVQRTQQRFYTPSIKFTHGDRAQIAIDMANIPPPAWFVVWPKNKGAAAEALRQRMAGQTYTVGGQKTNVLLMEDGWVGNPFTKGGIPNAFDEKMIECINSGGF